MIKAEFIEALHHQPVVKTTLPLLPRIGDRVLYHGETYRVRSLTWDLDQEKILIDVDLIVI